MDHHRFDNLTRALARTSSRRTLLAGLAGAIAAGLTGTRLPDTSAAQRAARFANGVACISSGQCASFRCVDGVCCDSACTGQCESCGTGTCSPVSGAPVGNRPACPGNGTCAATCDGVTRTHCAAYPGAETTCAAATCADGWQTTFACHGNRGCVPTTTSCGPFLCNPAGTACLTGCAVDADCVGEAFCAGGVCQGDRPLGEACHTDDQCQSGVCAQGVCCASACTGGCLACNLPGAEGFCTEVPDGGGCDGGTCCDGACVDTQSSLEHCGLCDNACRLVSDPGSCEDEPVCQAGVCAFTPLARDTECRPAAGPCDVAEVCDGNSTACPEDALLGDEVECRPAAGPCDVAEVCSGSSALCPPDTFQPNTTQCRASVGICDPAEFCTGSSAHCPEDQFAGGEVECRASVGVCDVAEVCSGSSATCPADEFRPDGDPCPDGVCCGGGCCDGGCCGGECVDLDTDATNCGACGFRCDDGVACIDGICEGVALELIDLNEFSPRIDIDDDLTVSLNGVAIFVDANRVGDSHATIAFTARTGDTLRVVATNTDKPDFYKLLSPLALRRVRDGAVQVLDAVGVLVEKAGAGVFYDREFTIEL